MRIQHNIMAMNSYRNYSNNTSSLSKNLEKLSSGYKINRAGDDAAGLAISEKMRAQITGLDAAQKNVKDATNMIKTAEGALQEVQDMLNRMVYLAEESANGIYDQNVDRAALDSEVTSLRNEIYRIADSANFNGKFLFSGDENMEGYSFQIGDSEQPYDRLTLSVGEGEALTNTADLRTLLTALDGLSVASSGDAVTAIATLKATGDQNNLINLVSTLRADLGAIQNRLDHTANNLSVMRENVQDAESGIRDTDVAEEMMAYTKNNILIQSAQAMLAQSNAVPQGVLQLLQ